MITQSSALAFLDAFRVQTRTVHKVVTCCFVGTIAGGIVLAAMLQACQAQQASASSLRYNQVQQISSHNSYADNGPKDDIPTQFRLGVRSFELDLHNSDEPRNWGVYHDSPPGDFVRDLKGGLAIFKRLHDLNPNHEVITIWLELKNDWKNDGHMPADLDSRIDQDLSTLVYRPANLTAGVPGVANLRDAVTRLGWPTLESLRGKFIFVTMGNDIAGQQYLESRGLLGSCFVAPEDDLTQKLYSEVGNIWLNSIFFNCHNNDGLEVPQAVYQRGLVSRIWRVDDQDEYDFALSSKAHHIASDHVTRDLFAPQLVDSDGNPFRPFGRDR